jgi:uncharacterized protein (TIGR02594 family)
MNPFTAFLEAITRLCQTISLWFWPSQPPEPEKPDDAKATDAAKPLPSPAGEPAWLALARKEDGVAEKPGKNHNPKILQYFADAGFAHIKDDETAWCAAFANAMLERAGYAGTKSLAARSFLTWGSKLNRPKLGCLVVLWRVSPTSWEGHVGFYVGEDANNVFLLDGNTGNKVGVHKHSKKRVLGYRWPTTAKTSRTVAASVIGGVGASATAVAQITPAVVGGLGDAALPIASELKTMALYFQIFGIVGSIIAILAYLMVLYARWDDLNKKGR